MKPAYISSILEKIAKRAGVRINIEARYKYAGQIILPNGKKRYFKGSSIDINPLGASEIAKDKDYAAYFMSKMGYAVPEGEAFFTREWCRTIGSDRNPDAAYQYARQLGFPVVLKPNSLSQGAGVSVVYTRREFQQALNSFSARDYVFLVQRLIPGRDYRIVVLDDEVISAYERLPLAVVGDGHSTIAMLLKQKQEEITRSGRDTIIKQDDPRIYRRLKRHRLNWNSIPADGQSVQLLDNRNLSAGGDAVDYTQIIHPTVRNLAVALTCDMGLRYCGVDIMIDGDIREELNRYVILEVNASPGLNNYARVGKAQERLVEQMYLKVLKALAAPQLA